MTQSREIGPSLTPEELAELKRLEAAATDAPWEAERDGQIIYIRAEVIHPYIVTVLRPNDAALTLRQTNADFALIAAMRNSFRGLLELVNQQKQDRADLVEGIRWANEEIERLQEQVRALEAGLMEVIRVCPDNPGGLTVDQVITAVASKAKP